MIATGGGVGVGVGRTGTDGVGVRAGVGVASAGVGLRSGVEEAARVGVAEAVGEGVASPPPVQAARRRAVASRGVIGRRVMEVQFVSAPANGPYVGAERFRCDA
jgi:hypothetical protein